MVGNIVEIVNGVDTKVWAVVMVVMAIVIVIGLIKKIAKTIILIALVIMLATSGATFVAGAMDKYGIEIDNTYLSIHNSNVDVDLDLRDIDKVEVKKSSASEVQLNITANGDVSTIKISDTVWNLFKDVIINKGVTVDEY